MHINHKQNKIVEQIELKRWWPQSKAFILCMVAILFF